MQVIKVGIGWIDLMRGNEILFHYSRLPSFRSLVFHEILFFDDVELLRSRLNPDIKHAIELTLEDSSTALFLVRLRAAMLRDRCLIWFASAG